MVALCELGFPIYSRAERQADRAVHLVGLLAGAIGVGWLFGRAAAMADRVRLAALAVYAAALLGMLAASAAYNLARPGRLKARLRKLDHAMIFIMIAGSYTPLCLLALPPRTALWMCGLVWVLCGVGVAIRVGWPNRFELACQCLYMGSGWLVLLVIRSLVSSMPPAGLWLLVGGGLVYSAGAALHNHGRIAFHNAIWHALVLVASIMHLVAIGTLVARA